MAFHSANDGIESRLLKITSSLIIFKLLNHKNNYDYQDQGQNYQAAYQIQY
jgi:hypothetical protein